MLIYPSIYKHFPSNDIFVAINFLTFHKNGLYGEKYQFLRGKSSAVNFVNYKYHNVDTVLMLRTPCEFMMWNGLPVIRKEIAESMISNYDLTQKEAARKLGVTPAAVCQYISNKRGKIKILDEMILEEIKESAERIIKHENAVVISETCRICKILRKKGVFSYDSCNCVFEVQK